MALVAAALCVLLAGCSPNLDWREFSWPEGGFSLLMPGRPAEESRTVTIGQWPLELHLFSSAASGDSYAIGYAPLPGEMSPEARIALLAEAEAAFARNLQGSASAQGSRHTDQSDCRQFRVEGKAGFLAGRLCATKSRYYQLLFISRKTPAAPQDVALFVDSLKLDAAN
jgi:hypothetical protein